MPIVFLTYKLWHMTFNLLPSLGDTVISYMLYVKACALFTSTI